MIINPDNPVASWFLVMATLFFAVVYALPLLFVPLRWARWFAWPVQEENKELTIYFGQCLGGVATAIILAIVRAIPDPGSHKLILELIFFVTGLMTVVHVWGAIRRKWPWTETVEIGMYAAVAIGAFWIRFFTLG